MTQNLNDKLEFLAEMSGREPLPDYLLDGLRPAFALRPYQVSGFADFIRYFESEVLRARPSQTLFHMATGSGKTLMMSGLILYLYRKGYRDFLFFVNSTNVLEKTRDNFLNAGSPKFLFNEVIRIDGHSVGIREVDNFQMSDPGGINICFTTIQGLHTDLNNPRDGTPRVPRRLYELDATTSMATS
jgi:type III restriction enzyme